MRFILKLVHNFVQIYRKRGMLHASKSSYLADNIKIYNRKNIILGDYVLIKSGAWIMNTRARFIMKKWSGSAFGLTVVTGSHMQIPGIKKQDITDEIKDKLDKEHRYDKDIIVEEEVWLGSRVTLLIGCHIGRGAIVGSGSVVRTDVPPYAIVEGNPAKIVGYRFKLDDIYKHENTLYQEEERLPHNTIEKHYYDFFGRPNNKQTSVNKAFSINDYKKVFEHVLNLAANDVETAEYRLTKGWDSVGHMSLVVELENTFGIVLPPEDFLNFHTYSCGLDILKRKGIEFVEEQHLSYPKVFFDFSSYHDSVAVQTKDLTYTYADIDDKSKDISKILRSNKIALLLARNTIGSIACYCGCIKNNIPVALLDAHKDVDFIENIINKYHPEYLILPTEDSFKYAGEGIGFIYDYTIKHLETTTYGVNKDLQLLLTTSGSTGSPKFVRLTKINIKSNAESIAQYLKLTSKERPITSLPMYYSYGISIINSHFIVGATIILTEDSVVTPTFWELAKEKNATSVSGVPYTYDLFKQMRVMDMDIPSLHTFTQAGGKMNKDNVSFFADKCRKTGRELIVMYGQTEASPRISYLPFDKAIEKSDSIGIPIPGVTLSTSEDGELICTGDNVFQGYAESYEDLSKGDECNGVLYTGDIAKKDEDGFFYIIGRKKRFVKVYGNRIGLDELEQLIALKFGKVVCVGRDDKVTIYSENKKLVDSVVINYISEKTKINPKAFCLRYMANLPYSNTGKVEYTKLVVN